MDYPPLRIVRFSGPALTDGIEEQQIDGARCQIQVEFGFGDAVTPGPEDVEYPVMLAEFAAPKRRGYPRYTVGGEIRGAVKAPEKSKEGRKPQQNHSFRPFLCPINACGYH